ncbi:hypothetical protein [Roseiarcus sp.]|uniref:hypothetical protein n=1 Tax=Roseiarcus sp. TaxID=1969460 RepID=UPI003F9C53D1
MSRSFSRYQVILLATTVLAGPLGVANAKVVPVPTYKLGLQEGAGAVTFVSGSSSPLSWGTITKSKAFGDFSKVSAQAAFPTTYPGQLTLTEYIMQSTKTSKILNLFEEAYNLVYTGNNVGVIPSFVGPSSFASDPVTGDSGLPAGWTLTDKLYFSSTNAKLGTSGNATSGLTYEGSVTFESNADGKTGSSRKRATRSRLRS